MLCNLGFFNKKIFFNNFYNKHTNKTNNNSNKKIFHNETFISICQSIAKFYNKINFMKGVK
jgi:hypothetical protein